MSIHTVCEYSWYARSRAEHIWRSSAMSGTLHVHVRCPEWRLTVLDLFTTSASAVHRSAASEIARPRAQCIHLAPRTSACAVISAGGQDLAAWEVSPKQVCTRGGCRGCRHEECWPITDGALRSVDGGSSLRHAAVKVGMAASAGRTGQRSEVVSAKSRSPLGYVRRHVDTHTSSLFCSRAVSFFLSDRGDRERGLIDRPAEKCTGALPCCPLGTHALPSATLGTRADLGHRRSVPQRKSCRAVIAGRARGSSRDDGVAMAPRCRRCQFPIPSPYWVDCGSSSSIQATSMLHIGLGRLVRREVMVTKSPSGSTLFVQRIEVPCHRHSCERAVWG